MNIKLVKARIEKNGIWTFMRSRGPGGQNVTKVNSKARLLIAFEEIEGLTSEEKELLKDQAKQYIQQSDYLFCESEKTRSQLQNRAIAFKKMVQIITQYSKKPQKRLATKPSPKEKQRRLTAKKNRSAIKSFRKNISEDNF